MASLGTLAAGVAHEINNPLTYVTLNLSFVRDQIRSLGFETERQADRFQLAVDRALEGSERVSAIVKDLRTLSRSDDGAVTVVDPRALLESALRMVGNDIRHRADLREDFGSIPGVVANEVRLSQVFVNLLVNAVQALASGDGKENRIEVRTRTDERGFAVVEVSDTGSGIHAEHLHKIFDPFFTTKPGLGTGIGLSLCHSTVKAMGGEIQVESSVGRGSLFRVLLPPAASAPRVAPQEGPAESVRRALARQRVLVMDDDLAVGEALKQALPGHEVTVVCSAAAGLEAARSCRFSAIFCDVMMPGMTGIDFFERLAEIDPTRSSRVVFITGGVLTEDARKFLDRHDAPCLEKPVSVAQLEAALARVSAASELLTPAQRAAEPVASRARTAQG
jgi:CheY-like chemotaxis protein/two-component sensor histidine kinase